MEADESRATETDANDADPDYVESLEDSGETNRNTNHYNRFIRGVMSAGTSNRHSAQTFNDIYLDLVDLGRIKGGFDERDLVTESKVQREKDRISKSLIGNFHSKSKI